MNTKNAEPSMGNITMSKKEREQLIIFKKLQDGEITQVEAGYRLKLTTRWIRKKFKRYLQMGDAGLVHKNRNRVSEKRWCEQEKALMIELLRSDWHDFGLLLLPKSLKRSRT